MKKINVSHYSDILCIWAYVSQIRIDELIDNFGENIHLEYYLFPVFGHALSKIDQQWEVKGGRNAYNLHVRDIADRFGHLSIHPDIWVKNTPESSLPSHLYACATKIAETNVKLAQGSYAELIAQFRSAFFVEAIDIAKVESIRNIIEEKKFSLSVIEKEISNGKAYAMLSSNMRYASDHAISVSPTLTFNEDRQRLSGNVGYRIIEANMKELIENPELKQSWC